MTPIQSILNTHFNKYIKDVYREPAGKPQDKTVRFSLAQFVITKLIDDSLLKKTKLYCKKDTLLNITFEGKSKTYSVIGKVALSIGLITLALVDLVIRVIGAIGYVLAAGAVFLFEGVVSLAQLIVKGAEKIFRLNSNASDAIDRFRKDIHSEAKKLGKKTEVICKQAGPQFVAPFLPITELSYIGQIREKNSVIRIVQYDVGRAIKLTANDNDAIFAKMNSAPKGFLLLTRNNYIPKAKKKYFTLVEGDAVVLAIKDKDAYDAQLLQTRAQIKKKKTSK